jgi:hypothetical protein
MKAVLDRFLTGPFIADQTDRVNGLAGGTEALLLWKQQLSASQEPDINQVRGDSSNLLSAMPM